jgi:hypothetical protein
MCVHLTAEILPLSGVEAQPQLGARTPPAGVLPSTIAQSRSPDRFESQSSYHAIEGPGFILVLLTMSNWR